MKKLFFSFITIIQTATSVFYDFENIDNFWNDCSFDGRLCDPQTKTPCCNQDHECTLTANSGYFSYQCKKFVKVGGNCESDFDCLMLDYAICKDSKCQCIENYSRSDSSKCVPLLGGNCLNTRNCAVENSICSKNYQCSCRYSYRPIDNNECKLSMLGKSCEMDYDCEDLAHMMCSRNECICRPFHTKKNGICNPILKGLCDSNRPCVTDNSECIDNKCQCKPGFRATDANECATEKSSI